MRRARSACARSRGRRLRRRRALGEDARAVRERGDPVESQDEPLDGVGAGELPHELRARLGAPRGARRGPAQQTQRRDQPAAVRGFAADVVVHGDVSRRGGELLREAQVDVLRGRLARQRRAQRRRGARRGERARVRERAPTRARAVVPGGQRANRRARLARRRCALASSASFSAPPSSSPYSSWPSPSRTTYAAPDRKVSDGPISLWRPPRITSGGVVGADSRRAVGGGSGFGFA